MLTKLINSTIDLNLNDGFITELKDKKIMVKKAKLSLKMYSVRDSEAPLEVTLKVEFDPEQAKVFSLLFLPALEAVNKKTYTFQFELAPEALERLKLQAEQIKSATDWLDVENALVLNFENYIYFGIKPDII